MKERDILAYAAGIGPRSKEIEAKAREILANKVKPAGSLGVLEDLAAAMAGIFGRLDYQIASKANVIFCADNGVWEEGFNKYPQQISRLVAEIMATGRGGGALLAATLGARISIVNLGLKGDYQHGRPVKAATLAGGDGDGGDGDGGDGQAPGGSGGQGQAPGGGQASIRVVDRVIRPGGAGNIARGPALTREQACQAMVAGIEEAESLIEQGVSVLSAGEIGLGNTTAAAAVLAAITGASPEAVTGMGSGTAGEALERKILTVAKALAVNRPEADDVIGVLARVGGLDIAAITGLYLACGRRRIPAVLDGFISLVAALCAARIQPTVRDYMIFSHHSAEKGAGLAARALGSTAASGDEENPALPPLHLGMRLGEGSGAVLMFPLLDCARQVLLQMASFEDLDRWFPGWQTGFFKKSC
jgi:nicotinate-nucleotide--dimethylbenzimidazole phosphoribosyltransferase